MNNIKFFKASSKLFSGYELEIDINYHESIDDIINNFKKSLIEIFKINNFEFLIDEVNKANFHIHSFTFEDILISKRNSIFYICDHC